MLYIILLTLLYFLLHLVGVQTIVSFLFAQLLGSLLGRRQTIEPVPVASQRGFVLRQVMQGSSGIVSVGAGCSARDAHTYTDREKRREEREKKETQISAVIGKRNQRGAFGWSACFGGELKERPPQLDGDPE